MRAHIGGFPVELDACLSPVVLALNLDNIQTTGSSCGYGRNPASIRLTPFNRSAGRIDLVYQEGRWQADWESLTGLVRSDALENRVHAIVRAADHATARYCCRLGGSLEHLLDGAGAALPTPVGPATVRFRPGLA